LPITLIAMSAAISSLFFGAIVIAILHDRRADRRHGDDDLSDDEASRIDDEVETIDGPSRLDDADEDGRRAGSAWACSRIRPPPRGPRTASAGRRATCCDWPASPSSTSPGPRPPWPGPGRRRCGTR